MLSNDLCLMSIINVYEVCYDAAKLSGVEAGVKLFEEIQQFPIQIINVISKELLKEEAMDFKTRYKISVADSFALGLARANQATLVSGDHHEFDAIEKAGELHFYWIR